MRLQKAIAHKGICSRRKAEELITLGKVKVNGKIVNELGVQVSSFDTIEVEGYEDKSFEKEDKVAFLFNKPLRVVSTVSDDRGRETVVDYFKKEKYRLYPVGRLDFNTSGALIMTNDGELANLITHPSSHLDKTYVITLDQPVFEEKMDMLRKGVLLEDGMTEPAIVNVITNTSNKSIIKITIHEGRNRQVRRMFNAVGYEVRKLHRESIGFLKIDNIERGQYRQISPNEISMIKKICLSNKRKNIIPEYKKK